MDIEADLGKGNRRFFFNVQLVQAEVRWMLEWAELLRSKPEQGICDTAKQPFGCAPSFAKATEGRQG